LRQQKFIVKLLTIISNYIKPQYNYLDYSRGELHDLLMENRQLAEDSRWTATAKGSKSELLFPVPFISVLLIEDGLCAAAM
jgi:hypothetical protein